MTHTFVTIEVPPECYYLVRSKLLAAGYDHAVDDKNRELDMHGLALTIEASEQPSSQP